MGINYYYKNGGKKAMRKKEKFLDPETGLGLSDDDDPDKVGFQTDAC